MEVGRGITARSIILGGIVFIFSLIILAYSFHRVPGGNFEGVHYIVYFSSRWGYSWNTIFFPLILIIAALQLLHRKLGLTRQEWTIVFSILSMIWPMLFWVGIYTWAAQITLPPAGFRGWDRLLEYIPDSWTVKDELIAKAYFDRRSYELAFGYWPIHNVLYAEAWAVPLVVWTLFGIFIGLLTYGLALIFRRPFVDIEKLPFPGMYPNLSLIEMASTPAKAQSGMRAVIFSRKAMYFWLGFAVAFILELFNDDGVTAWLIWEKNPLPWEADIDYSGAIGPPGGAPVFLNFWNMIYHVGIAFIFPLDILFTGLLFFLIWHWIVPWGLVAAGLYPAGRNVRGFGVCWPAVWGDEWAEAYQMQFLTMWLGIALFTVWQTRGYWLESFRSFLRGGGAEAAAGEPCSNRTIWLVFLTGSIGLLAWMIASGIHPWMSLVVVVYIILVQIAIIRMRGELWSGMSTCPWGFRTQHTVAPTIRLTGSVIGMPIDEAANSLTAFGSGFVLSTPLAGGSYQPWAPNVAGIYSYKMAAETKTSARDVFRVQMPTLILGMILTTFLGWLVVGTGGMKNWEHGWTMSWDGALNNMGQAVWATEGTGFTTRPLSVPTMTWGAIGIIEAIVLMYLRMRLPWLPINIVGVPLLIWTQAFGMFTIFIAFIWKLLTLKIGGVRVYENIMVPIAMGIFFGSIVHWLILFPVFLQFMFWGWTPLIKA